MFNGWIKEREIIKAKREKKLKTEIKEENEFTFSLNISCEFCETLFYTLNSIFHTI